MTDPVQVFDGDGYKPCPHCAGTGWARNGWSCMGCGGEGVMNEKAREYQKKVCDTIVGAGDAIRSATQKIIGMSELIDATAKNFENLNDLVADHYKENIIVDADFDPLAGTAT